MNQEMPTFDVSSIPAEFNPLSTSTFDGNADKNLYANDDKLFVQFKTEAVLNPSKSTKEGRPIYDNIDMIVIRAPGSQLTSIVAPAKHYMNRFGERYRKWKSSQSEAASGTPLENFPFLFANPSLIAELKYRNIFTVEQLASIPDNAKQTIMGGHELCRMANEWITKTKGEVEDAEKAELKQRLADMEAKLASLTAPTATLRKSNKAAPAAAPQPEQVPDFMKE